MDALESGVDLVGQTGGSLEVVVSANGGQVDGNVQESNAPAPRAIVTLVSLDPRRAKDLFKSTVADAAGHFTVTGLAPGSYKAYAWDDVEINAVRYDPDFVKPYETQGETIRVDENGHASATLKLIAKPADQ